MMKEHDHVLLRDGREGWILGVYEGGKRYRVMYETEVDAPDGPDKYTDDLFDADELELAE